MRWAHQSCWLLRLHAEGEGVEYVNVGPGWVGNVHITNSTRPDTLSGWVSFWRMEMRAQFQWAGPSLRNGLYCYWCGIGNDSTRTRQYRFPRTHQGPDHHRTKKVGPKYNTTNFDTWRAHGPQTTTVRCSPFLGLLGLDKTWKGSEPGGKSRWLLRIHFKNKLYLGMI